MMHYRIIYYDLNLRPVGFRIVCLGEFESVTPIPPDARLFQIVEVEQKVISDNADYWYKALKNIGGLK